MHLHIFHMEMQMSHFRGQARTRSGTPNSTKEKIGAHTCLEGSGQTLSVTIMCRREISASFYRQMVGEDSRLPSIYFPQQLLIPDVEKFFFWMVTGGRESPPECIDIKVGQKPVHQWLQGSWQTTYYKQQARGTTGSNKRRRKAPRAKETANINRLALILNK